MKEKGRLFKAEETFEKMYKEIFLPVLQRFGVAEEDQPYVFAYYSSGVTAVIMKWVELDCKKPAEEIIALIADFLPMESGKLHEKDKRNGRI